MKKILIFLCAIFLVSCITNISGATVIDFDDITTSTSGAVPSDYKGFNWGINNFGVIIDYCDGYSYQTTFNNTYGSPSGEYATYNWGGPLNVSMSSNEVFDFTGAFFTTWATNDDFNEYSSTSITVLGYHNDTLIGTVSMILSANRYDWLQADLRGVNKLVFQSSGNEKWWLMDNFIYNETSPVTEILALNVDIHPDTLNIKNKGNWMTCHIEPSDGYSASDIDVSSVTLAVNALSISIPAEFFTEIYDYDDDSILDLMVKFDREILQSILLDMVGSVEMTVSGFFMDGTGFEGTDTVLVINTGKAQ